MPPRTKAAPTPEAHDSIEDVIALIRKVFPKGNVTISVNASDRYAVELNCAPATPVSES